MATAVLDLSKDRALRIVTATVPNASMAAIAPELPDDCAGRIYKEIRFTDDVLLATRTGFGFMVTNEKVGTVVQCFHPRDSVTMTAGNQPLRLCCGRPYIVRHDPHRKEN